MYFSSHSLYYNGQYGFREKHSTQLAALELINRISQDLDQGITPINVYLDLLKAFDTFDHNILLSKLQFYGFTNSALKLCKNYLSDRKQFVQINNAKSFEADITMGVPQGSIFIIYLLFIIYMNDIIHSSNSFQFIMFADDTTLFTTLNSNEHYGVHNERLNNELEKISNWLKVNKLSLNVKKTKAMIFHMPQKKVQLPLLQIAESNIEYVDNFNFLGITINKHLNWTSHVDALASKISKTIGVLSSLKHILSIHILRTIYNSLIVCHLNYGVLVWGKSK